MKRDRQNGWSSLGLGLSPRLFRIKTLDEKSVDESPLARCLGTTDLVMLGVGSTLGVGIYVLAGSVAKVSAGPSIVLSFAIAGLASMLSGLCYAEMGARVPRAGSAYVYSYSTVGELVGFIIGWNLLLEYTIGAASVARGYSGYVDSMTNRTISRTLAHYLPTLDLPWLSTYPDLLALCLTLAVTGVLAAGVKESTRFNNVFTGLNLCVVAFVIVAGMFRSQPGNWSLPPPPNPLPPSTIGASDATPRSRGRGGFFPFGVSGTLAGAATCFFGYVGFDGIATSGEEAREPQKTIPKAIAISLVIVFLSYFGVSSVLTLMVPYFAQDPDAPLIAAFRLTGLDFAGNIVAVGALFGLSASLMGAMFPMPRILYSMAADGLVFRWLSDVNQTCQTPLKATLLGGLFAGLTSALLDLRSLVDMMSIGTLMAYTTVAGCVLVLRYRDPSSPGGLTSSQCNGSSSGSGSGSGHGYLALSRVGGISAETASVLRSPEDDDADGDADGDSEEELIYGRSEDLESGEDLKLGQDANGGGVARGGDICGDDLLHLLLNTAGECKPTARTERMSTLLAAVYTAAAIGLALMVDKLEFSNPLLPVSLLLLLLLMLACLVCLGRQPTTRQKLSFRVPLVPLLPAASILVNVYLMLQLSLQTWLRFLVWMTLGFLIYFGYGLRNSSEEYRMRGEVPPGSKVQK